ncbi:MAG: prephenate dehydrogenase/arogenate dehydrogenase family protein [Candidatus Eremiobacteraeota bacterium]|nr:prephenate dehydrogenase/arogenate dehydrogenase family protein [Candidatus Eremiobacteraeota bacterium]
MTAATVGVFGVGAIGGSIGLRARQNGMRVIGADCDSAVLEAAREVGAIDDSLTGDELGKIVNVLVLAPHVGSTLQEIERLKSESGSMPELIVDIASVKMPVVRAASGLANFVATHPMAGTERSGVRAARGDLFEGRTWAYVPSGDQALDERARTFIESMGAVPFAISAEGHDRAVAIASHVPQIVAWCYATLLRDQGPNAEKLCGPVARELLRISGMSSAMWRDILSANADNIEPNLRNLVKALDAYDVSR